MHIHPTLLILSPCPPTPEDHGNRSRVHQLCKFFTDIGFQISFILYPADKDWSETIPPYYKEIKEYFYYFDVIPKSQQSYKTPYDIHHHIDEWWDPNIEVELEWIFSRKKFDVFLVNYVYFSKAFDYCPNHTLKILDTHDIFTGRREMFEKFGVPPEFFYTNLSEEKIGLNRADVVIAIKKSEEIFFDINSESQVICIPYYRKRDLDEFTLIMSEDRRKNKIRAGFIGSNNSVNSKNLINFLNILNEMLIENCVPLEIIVAGSVCEAIRSEYPWCKLLGKITAVSNFYDNIDVFTVPFEFSTGIKTKIAEALAFGKPIISTANAFDGYVAFHETQCLPTVRDLCTILIQIASGKINLSDLIYATAKAAEAAKTEVEIQFGVFRSIILSKLDRTFVLVSNSFWQRKMLFDEMCYQCIEFISQKKTVIVVCDPKLRDAHLDNDCPFPIIFTDFDEFAKSICCDVGPFYPHSIFDFRKDANKNSFFSSLLTQPKAGYWELRFGIDDIANTINAVIFCKNQNEEIAVTPFRYLPQLVRRNITASERNGCIILVHNMPPGYVSFLRDFFTRRVRSNPIKFVILANLEDISVEYLVNIGIFSAGIVLILGQECVSLYLINSLLNLSSRPYLSISEKSLTTELRVLDSHIENVAVFDKLFHDALSIQGARRNKADYWEYISQLMDTF